MRITSIGLAVSVALLAAGSVPLRAQAKDPALEKLAADWAAAFAKGDAKTLASYYTENAIRMTPEGGTLVGRAAIEKEFATNVAGPWKGAKIAIKLGSTHSVGADVAVNEGTWEVSGATGPDGKPLSLKGNYLNTIVKKGGAWMIASNAAAPPAPAPAK
jgi:uncharacterized protein (TIGR02246 family)